MYRSAREEISLLELDQPNHTTFHQVVSILGPADALDWYPSHEDVFFELELAQIEEFRKWLHSLLPGCVLPIRGRDWVCLVGSSDDKTDWEYGYCIKDEKDSLWFLYEDGKIEHFHINVINFVDLVHPVRNAADHLGLQEVDPSKVIILSHGWSEKLGPNYPVIRTLEKVAARKGWKVVIPDFRGTYKYGSHGGDRDRSERVKSIYAELLCLDPKPQTVVLVGHSQGGAASAFACDPRVVKAQNIKGLLMVGTENPLAMDGMDWKPIVENVQFIHAEGDCVIWPIEIESIANAWGVPFVVVSANQGTKAKIGKLDPAGDCLRHDFLLKELMLGLVKHFEEFLDKCNK